MGEERIDGQGMSEWHQHLPVLAYSRPWRRLFRKTYELRCWACPAVISER